MPVIDPYEPMDPFDYTSEQFVATSEEIARVLALSPWDAFAELRPLLQFRMTAAGPSELHALRRIAMLAESLDKWWIEGGQDQVIDDSDGE